MHVAKRWRRSTFGALGVRRGMGALTEACSPLAIVGLWVGASLNGASDDRAKPAAATASVSICLEEHRSMHSMNEPPAPVTIALRIPGQWANPQELIQRLPAGCRMTAEAVTVQDGPAVSFGAGAADNQFAQIFRSSWRDPATEEELAEVDGYTANVFLSGPGGSLPAAHAMMRAAAAVVRAGGAGV